MHRVKIKKQNPFITNLTGTKNCYISTSERNSYTINWLYLVFSYSSIFFPLPFIKYQAEIKWITNRYITNAPPREGCYVTFVFALLY